MSTDPPHRYAMEELLGIIPPKWEEWTKREDTFLRLLPVQIAQNTTQQRPGFYLKKTAILNLWMFRGSPAIGMLPNKAANAALGFVMDETLFDTPHEAMAALDNLLEEHGF